MRRLVVLPLLAALPSPAFAHASGMGYKLLLPTGYTIIGGTLAVALTFLVMLAMPRAWAERMLTPMARITLPMPRLEIVTSLLGTALLAALLWIGWHGSTDPLANPLPLTVWTLWWIGLTLACALFGNLWALINPWSGLASVCRLREPRARLPIRLGYWPAILTIMAFGWFENISLAPEDPAGLARIVALYAVSTLALCALFGANVWLARGEAFSVFFRFIGRLAPVQISREGRVIDVSIGMPGFALAGSPVPISGAIFILVALATVSFDGLSETFWWLDLLGINPLEFPGRSAVVTQKTLGILAAWTTLAGAFFIACWLGAVLAGASHRAWELAGCVVLSIVPIALAYHAAHYLTAFLVNGQYAMAALTDPFALGDDWLGIGPIEVTTSFFYVRDEVARIWWSQAGAIVIGHLLAVISAHALALRVFASPRRAMLSQIPLAVLMIGYTAFGLWLLAQPTGA